jgi:large subunit ribosomal protein L35
MIVPSAGVRSNPIEPRPTSATATGRAEPSPQSGPETEARAEAGLHPRLTSPPGTTSRNLSPMPKLKTHKGTKKRFKVSANGKVSHKRCGSSHLMSHKNGKQVRRLRKKSFLTVEAEAHRLRRALHKNIGVNPVAVEAAKEAALADARAEASGAADPTEPQASSSA